MLGLIRNLRKAGVLGINSRNRGFVMRHNKRKLYKFVDNKVYTKQLAAREKIAVPELYGLISTVHDTRYFENLVSDRKEFVIKPAHGSGGNGIMVIANRRKNLFIKPDGIALDSETVKHHIANILGGTYSLGGQVDQAIIEYRVQFDPVFHALSYQGVPDSRMLVYRGVPTMAMLRLPTRQSQGRANLHQGAVGVGIDIKSGITTHAVHHNHRIFEHPDFGSPLSGCQIPEWENLLLLSAKCYDMAPLGYLGVDMVLDANLGALVLELNARPGLSIQIANGCGLEHRFNAIDMTDTIPDKAEDRALLAKTVNSSV